MLIFVVKSYHYYLSNNLTKTDKQINTFTWMSIGSKIINKKQEKQSKIQFKKHNGEVEGLVTDF